ncbi:leukocyte immunoglobulin-like receptor subfamily A member 6, partial [Terrapene carolina triunguis]|uniref:leukocyte immunoglobulin-like receptor subfamily A member 6 n=1 Tax=Terrapene triunguis TaxID=2587831 RepID=UPI000E77CA33
MASALTVLFLGCWFAGRSGVSEEWFYPKPSISVSPSGVIPMGGNVTIRCRHQRLGMRILLYKAGDWNYLNYTDPAGSEAEFPITSARREHGGIYTCRYSNRTVRAAYSEPSDPVQIIVAEGSLPKPSISVSPGGVIPVGGNVTIRCRHQRLGLRFLLYKAGVGNYPNYTDPAGSEAEFPITSARREHGGSYTCRYHNRTGSVAYSEASDPVQIIVADPSLPRPSISLSPTGVTAPGADATIWCQDPSLPRPSISLSLTLVTASGADVTIRCQGQRRDVTFFLHKAGDLNPQRHMDPAGDGAEFLIPTVGRQHGGSYSCSYRNRSEPFISSLPSDPVQLVVAGISEPSAAPVLTCTIIAGVSTAATVLLFLLLLLIFLCYRRIRGRKGPALRQSRESEAAATVYALMGEGKQLDVL